VPAAHERAFPKPCPAVRRRVKSETACWPAAYRFRGGLRTETPAASFDLRPIAGSIRSGFLYLSIGPKVTLQDVGPTLVSLGPLAHDKSVDYERRARLVPSLVNTSSGSIAGKRDSAGCAVGRTAALVLHRRSRARDLDRITVQILFLLRAEKCGQQQPSHFLRFVR